MFIHIRFGAALFTFGDELVADLKPPRYIIAEEVGSVTEKVHRHMCIETELSLEGLKKRFQKQLKQLGLTGKRGHENEHYGGTRECDDEGAYVCKYGNIVGSKGYSESELSELIVKGAERYAYRLNPVTDASGGIVKPPKPKFDGDKFCEEIVADLKPKALTNEITVRDALNVISKRILKFKFARINDGVAFPLIQSCLYRLFPHWVEEDFANRMAKKFSYLTS